MTNHPLPSRHFLFLSTKMRFPVQPAPPITALLCRRRAQPSPRSPPGPVKQFSHADESWGGNSWEERGPCSQGCLVALPPLTPSRSTGLFRGSFDVLYPHRHPPAVGVEWPQSPSSSLAIRATAIINVHRAAACCWHRMSWLSSSDGCGTMQGQEVREGGAEGGGRGSMMATRDRDSRSGR